MSASPNGTGRRLVASRRRRVDTIALAVVTSMLCVLCVPSALTGQGTDAPTPELERQTVHGLTLETPGALEEVQLDPTLRRQILDVPAFENVALHLWTAEDRGLSLTHFRLAKGASYDLEKGLQGAVDRAVAALARGRSVTTRYWVIEVTQVSGAAARVATRRLEAGEQSLTVKALAIREHPDVWMIAVFGPNDPSLRRLAERIFASASLRDDGAT